MGSFLWRKHGSAVACFQSGCLWDYGGICCFQTIGCEIVMAATATDVPSLSVSDVSADTSFLMPVWVTAALGEPPYNPLLRFCHGFYHF